MTITSSAFQNNDPIPAKYGYDGNNVNPPLTFSEVPPEAKSLALILEDPDAPGGTFTHWLLYNIAPATLQILEGTLPIGAHQATNGFGQQAYGGPKPPDGKHHYHFKLLALDTELDLEPAEGTKEFYHVVDGHIIAHAELVGTFTA